MVREEWEDAAASYPAQGCLLDESSGTSFHEVLVHDVKSDAAGARFSASLKSTFESFDKYTDKCVGCSYIERHSKRILGSGVVDADIYIGIDFEEGVSALSISPWDSIYAQISTTTIDDSTCGPRTEQGASSEKDIVGQIDELGYWSPGTTPGSYIVYGSRVETNSSGDHHWRDTYAWRFVNKQDVRLVIDAVDFDTWRPLAPPWTGSLPPPSKGGAHLKLVASLLPLPSSSSTVLPKATKITFKLLKSSAVPGIAMNVPLFNEALSPQDLQFEQTRNEGLGMVFLDKDNVRTAPGNLYEFAEAELSSFDSGAYGEVTAEAELEDGSVITARFRDTGDNPMRIPKRARDSYVAEKWLADHAAGMADSADDENLAGGAGDGHSGDGLTVYEEYRGFFAKGTWFDTHPTDVDFMLVNDTNGWRKADIDSGILRFASASNLKVHAEFATNDLEMPIDNTDFDEVKRIVNLHPLTEGGRHKVDQHAVVMRIARNSQTTISQTYGGPNTPRKISQIELSQVPTGDKLVWTVAHELGHSVNIPHHGEGGMEDRYWAFQPNGSYHETPNSTIPTGNPVILKLEDTGQIFSPGVSTAVSVSTKLQGLGSGDETCIMRYPVMTGIHWVTEPGVRYFINPAEPFGVSFCVDGTGKTFNSNRTYPNGSPRPSRHGDAAPGRGNCMHRTCVNDFYHP
ncbi:hypothetical protein MYSTI_05727 [Myxococcus stipitatus DSM 14675]|uniref:Uncharacterized protein n=2 Tax=Myxococcus stipitatus TaxID=83455 RepID=L7UG56_MYXSD|nr:hypothetical protein MYSTI_05727 [Myxococcus stipitatus DSM 14675]